MVKFMVDKEKEVMDNEGATDQGNSENAGNVKDWRGWTPVFYAKRAEIVELLLKIDNLELKNGNGDKLLWHCAKLGIVNEQVAKHFKNRLGTRVRGRLPLEEGEKGQIGQ